MRAVMEAQAKGCGRAEGETIEFVWVIRFPWGVRKVVFCLFVLIRDADFQRRSRVLLTAKMAWPKGSNIRK